MIGDKRVLAIIPARGSSKGIYRKNIRMLAGKPLIAWTIDVAHNVREIDRVILTTDDPEIATVGQRYGCDVPFMRPNELAGDNAPGIAPVLHALEMLPGYDIVVLLQPTSPLRLKEDVVACIKVVATGAPACVTVQSLRHGIHLLYEMDSQANLVPACSKEFSTARRQDTQKVQMLNGAVYAADIAELLKHKSFLFQGMKAHEMPPHRSIDIDDQLDLEMAELLLSKGFV
jgi:CMP-N,N'-diacetyllegionaminic acid synthase